MSELRTHLLSIQVDGRTWSVLGAVVLHGLIFGLLALWRPAPLPERENTIPIILIELPAPLPEPEPVVERIPEIAQETTQTEAEEAPQEKAPPAPEPDDDVIPEVAPLSGAVNVQLDEEDADTAEPEELEIDPRYVVEFDPFAEVNQSAMARIARGMSCSRVNRDARPDLCPDFSGEGVYVAGLNRAEAGQYVDHDPVFDLVARPGWVNTFAAGQMPARPTGGSELRRLEPKKVPRHPDGLRGCTTFSSGSLDGAEAKNDLSLGYADGIFCE